MGMGFPESHTGDYYSRGREHFVDFVACHVTPRRGRVLDVGCSTGLVGDSLLTMGWGEVWGIESSISAAEQARRRLTRVVGGLFPEAPEVAEGAPYDLMIFADSLEHMANPWGALDVAHGLLRPGGVVALSVPNVAHYSVVAGLLCGTWEYENEGLLDRTHLRFFTPRSLDSALTSAGFSIAARGANVLKRRRRDVWFALPLGVLAKHCLTYQYYVTAVKEPRSSGE